MDWATTGTQTLLSASRPAKSLRTSLPFVDLGLPDGYVRGQQLNGGRAPPCEQVRNWPAQLGRGNERQGYNDNQAIGRDQDAHPRMLTLI